MSEMDMNKHADEIIEDMKGPISPSQVADCKKATFPSFVFEAVNELIAENYTSGRAEFTQDKVIERMLSKGAGTGVTRSSLFENGWLNFEEVYRASGWSVYYDKPGYNESYRANFTFKKA